MCYVTQAGDFHVSEGETKVVKYLRDTEVIRLYAEAEGSQILTLKYQDDVFSFSIILPKERFGLGKLRAGLTGDKLQKMMNVVRNSYLNIKFPKFNIEKEMNLTTALKSFGVEEVFTDQADLSGIAPKIQVSEVLHKAVIEVDEVGTKAAAATMVRFFAESAIIGEPNNFTADHPFIFVVRHQNSVVFLGQFCG